MKEIPDCDTKSMHGEIGSGMGLYLSRVLHSEDGPNFDFAWRRNVESAGIMSRASKTATTAISTGSSVASAALAVCLPYTKHGAQSLRTPWFRILLYQADTPDIVQSVGRYQQVLERWCILGHFWKQTRSGMVMINSYQR